MRQTYHIRLDALGGQAAQLCRRAQDILRDATEAVLTANLHLAEATIDSEADLQRMRTQTEETVLELLVLQSPVASDLRTVVSALWVISDLERMGGLAVHVAKVAQRRYPDHAVPRPLRSTIQAMGDVGVRLASSAEQVLLERNIDLAIQMDSDDDEMDRLQAQILTEVNSADWSHGIQPAIDAAMLGRFYERFGDHAVAVSRRMIFLVTGHNVGGDTTPAI